MKLLTREVKIGIAGITALALLFIGINFLKGINLFKATNYYYVSFKNAKELAQSSPVYADGYNIGIVRNIIYDYERPQNVLVEIQVDNGMRIPKGSTAELSTQMLGGCTLNLLLANNPRERYEPGDTIRGNDSSGLMDKAGAMIPQMEQIINKVDTLLTSLNRLTSDPNLPVILSNAQQITDNLNQTTVQLNRLMNKDVPQMTTKFNKIGDNVIQLTDNLNKLDLANTLAKVDQTLNEVKATTAKLNSKDNSLGLLLNDDGLYTNLNLTLGSANELLIDLKEHPKRYVHFSLFGKKDK